MTTRIAALLLVLTVMYATTAAGKGGRKMEPLTVSSPAFELGGVIPLRYTCDGNNVNPPLAIGKAPSGARSMALIMDDPDAPAGDWVHWVVWNIPVQTREIPENSVPPNASQGRNSWNRNNYGGPCPPSGTHRYFFRLFALDTPLQLGSSSSKADLERAMQGHILAKGEMMGTCRRH